MSGAPVVRLMNLIVLAVVAGLSALPGCSDPPPPPPPRQGDAAAKHTLSVSANDPTLVVSYDAGMPADPESRSSGVRLAVWEDGTVLAATDPLHPDRSMRVGRLTSEQAAAAWSALDQSGFFAQPDTFLVAPDSAYVKITARSGGDEEGAAARTHTHSLDTYYQSQTAWWPRVEAALAKFHPDETGDVTAVAEKGVFRGYIVAEWWRTPWAR